jgi:glycine betaine/proline transport system ATP-binding protein
VADEAGTLLGVIPRVTLLAALGAISTHVDEVVESSGEDAADGAEPALAMTKEGSVDD